MRTAQQIFDTVVRHLRQQGAKSSDEMHCLYRDPNGRKCALGCLIDEAHYVRTMEYNSLTKLLETQILGDLKLEFQAHKNLLIDLQDTHDNLEVEKWEGKFVRIAMDFGLTLPAK